MNAKAVKRLRGMTRGEMSWRARQAARIAAQRASARMRPPRWRREDLRSVLRDGVLDRALLPACPTEGHWQTAHAELARQIRARTARFGLDPAHKADIRAAVLNRWPGAAADATARADRLLAGRYDLLGYRALDCTGEGGAVDWHADPVHQRRAPLAFWADVPYLDPAVGDHKVIWELNRHQHWIQLGRALWLADDQRCRRAIVDQLYEWLAANPPLCGINWASMLELALRSISWTWALHFLIADEPPRGSAPDRPWLVDMLVAIDRQLTHVEQNLSLYFSPNTHLTGEALALYVVGVALPELAASSRWAKRGRTILLSEIDRQILADGGHAERSTHYQRYTLDFYLMALVTAERDGDEQAASRFADAAARLAEFTSTIADDTGRLPLIGDDDGGMLWPITGRDCADVRDSLAVASVLLDRPALAPSGLPEETFWVAGRRAVALTSRGDEPPGGDTVRVSRTLADTGYVVLRDGAGAHAVFDVGPHGYMNGGHAHADALALTLTLAGQPLLVDPGTSTYTMDPLLRDRLRSSMSHNTVALEDRSQAVPCGPFHWQTRADARLHASRHNPAFDWAEGAHDGYAPLRHRRTLLRVAASGWLVVDEVLGTGQVSASMHWHFDPRWMLRCDAAGRLEATSLEDDTAAWLLYDGGDVWLVHGDERSGLGWHAPVYGQRLPTWTARITRRAAAPYAALTWLAARDGTSAAPRLERVPATPESGGAAIGARVVDGDRTLVFLVRPGEPASREGRACGIGEYQTDARLVHYAEDGRLLTLALVDASHALALREGWITVAAGEPIADLHIARNRDTLYVHASQPPGQLRLQGRALAGVRYVHLNHREMPLPGLPPRDTIVIAGGDWPVGMPQVPSRVRLLLPSSRPDPVVASVALEGSPGR